MSKVPLLPTSEVSWLPFTPDSLTDLRTLCVNCSSTSYSLSRSFYLSILSEYLVSEVTLGLVMGTSKGSPVRLTT